MKTYRGTRDHNETPFVAVLVEGTSIHKALPLRLDISRHSPGGFEWGYSGSGPSQLALAIMADHLEANLLDRPLARTAGGCDDSMGDPAQIANRVHQNFKAACIAGLPKEGWELTSDQIHDILEKLADQKKPPRFDRDDVV